MEREAKKSKSGKDEGKTLGSCFYPQVPRTGKARVYVVGDSHCDVWKAIGRLPAVKKARTFIVNRIAGASAQGLSNPTSTTRAFEKWLKMVDARRDECDLLVIMVGSVDLHFVLPSKWARQDEAKLSRTTVAEQFESSLKVSVAFEAFSLIHLRFLKRGLSLR